MKLFKNLSARIAASIGLDIQEEIQEPLDGTIKICSGRFSDLEFTTKTFSMRDVEEATYLQNCVEADGLDIVNALTSIRGFDLPNGHTGWDLADLVLTPEKTPEQGQLLYARMHPTGDITTFWAMCSDNTWFKIKARLHGYRDCCVDQHLEFERKGGLASLNTCHSCRRLTKDPRHNIRLNESLWNDAGMLKTTALLELINSDGLHTNQPLFACE